MKPILFNTEMVKSILKGKKTQTRRPIELNIKKDNKSHSLNGAVFTIDNKLYFEHNLIENFSKYKVGDVFWVREPAKVIEINDYQDCFTFKYLADNKEETLSYLDKWENKDGMTVPRWVENCQDIPNGCIKEMARIFLKITNVRVERLQDISVRDIEKECGWRREIYSYSNKNKAFIRDYCDFWNSTAKDGYKWEDDPCVFVYEFERIHDV